MTSETSSVRRLRVLATEYGSFRAEVLEFAVKEVIPGLKSILDPMCGSAPFAPYVEAAGGTGHFNDILPFHYFINKGKSYPACRAYRRLERPRAGALIKEVVACLSGLRRIKMVVSRSWIDRRVLAAFEEAWKSADGYGGPLKDLVRAILILCVRPFSCHTRSTSNPTWLKEGGASSGRPLDEVVVSSVGRIASYFETRYSSAPLKRGKCHFYRRTALNLRLRRPVQAIFTSPPYNNRLEPTIMYGPELFLMQALGYTVKAGRILGTTRVRDYPSASEDIELVAAAAPRAARFLDEVARRATKKESEYYLRYHARFYGMLFRMLTHLSGLLARGGICMS